MPLRVLVGLTAAVLAAHFWLLRSAPVRVTIGAPTRAPAFSTRSIDPQPVPVAPATPAKAAQAPPPRLAAAPVTPAIPVGPAGRAATPAPAAGTPAAEAESVLHQLTIPAPVRLAYEVTAQGRRGSWQGRSELQWQHDGEGYEARLEVTAPGLPARVQHSAGRLGAQGLAPLRFSDKSRGEQATHFERDAGRVSFSNNRPAAPLLAGAQDRLSVLVQLGAMFSGEPGRYPPGTTISLQTASTHAADSWQFTVGSEEQLQLPGGPLLAVKLIRPPRHEYDQRIEVWLAPGQAYAPVRLRLTQPNGDWVDHQWSSTDRR
jgi:hypothetical protein